MSKSGLLTFTYWTALPTVTALLVGCSDDTAPQGPVIAEEAGVSSTEASSSEEGPASPPTSTSTSTTSTTSNTTSPASTTAPLPTDTDPTTGQTSGPESTPPNSPVPVDPSAFPVGLAVESLLSHQESAPGVVFLQWRDSQGNEVTAAEQITQALAATSIEDCAVKLPPLTPAVSPTCYGPALEYANHPDGACEPPMDNAGYCRFPGGDLGMWSATEGETQEACTAAKFNADVNSVGLRVDAALVTAASAACALAMDGIALPTSGQSADATAALQRALAVHQPGIEVASATITNASEDGPLSTFIYTIESTHDGQTLRYSLRHNTGGDALYSGRLWGELTSTQNNPPPPPPNPMGGLQAYISADGGSELPMDMDGSAPPPPDCDGGMCSPPSCDGPDCPTPPPPSCDGGPCAPVCLGPDCPEPPPPPPSCDGGPCPPPSCTSDNCPPPPCVGDNCPLPGDPILPPNPGPSGGNAEVFSVTYELTSNAHLRTHMLSKRGAAGGAEAFTVDGQLAASGAWTSSMSLTVLDVDQTTDTGKGAYLWQAGPHDDRTRVFNVFTEPADDGEKTGCGFFGYGAPFGASLPDLGIENFVCNWAGPGNNHNGVAHFAQKQCMAPNVYGVWEPTESFIAYAPSNSCASADEAFAGGPMNSTPDEWTPFAAESELVDLSEDADYAAGFGSGPTSPNL